MKNEQATPEIKAFAKAVLKALKNGEYEAHEMYLHTKLFQDLRALALDCENAFYGPDGSGTLVVQFNNQRICLMPCAGNEKAPYLFARCFDGRAHYSRTGTGKAARIMLDKLPQETRTGLTDEERDHVAGKINAGASFAFVDQMLVAVLRATPKQTGKLVRAFPRTFHRLLKDFTPEA